MKTHCLELLVMSTEASTIGPDKNRRPKQGWRNTSGRPGMCWTKISKLQTTITIYVFGMYMHRYSLTGEFVISFLSIVL